MTRREPPYAIVHDHLVQRGGAERVVASMARFLEADIHTALYEPAATHPEVSTCRIRPSALDRFRWFRSNHRWAFPLLAPLFMTIRPRARTTILSTIGWSHFARPHGRRVAYWYAPARWLHQTDVYVGDGFKGRAVRVINPVLRRLDRWAVDGLDAHLAISNEIGKRINALYGVDVKTVHPPVTFDGDPRPVDGIEPGFLLTVSRFMRYKNLDLVIEAVSQRPDLRLIVVGSGPDERRLRSLATPNVTFLGQIDDDELAWLYKVAAGLVTAAHEDFGLTPLEAAMFGTPSAALRAGGFLDTIIEGETGVFIESATVPALQHAIDVMLTSDWAVEALASQAARFSEAAFHERLTRALVDIESSDDSARSFATDSSDSEPGTSSRAQPLPRRGSEI